MGKSLITKIIRTSESLNGTQFHEDQPKRLQMGSLQNLPWPSKCYMGLGIIISEQNCLCNSRTNLLQILCKSGELTLPFQFLLRKEASFSKTKKTFFNMIFHQAKIRQIHSNLWRSFSSDVQILFSEVDIFNQTKKRCHMILFMTYPHENPSWKLMAC